MKQTKEYTAWANMKSRCSNPKNKAYRYYGGRGICEKFPRFQDFIAHLGPCPDGMSLDRIDNNGHYEIGNVRWATKRTQMCNRSDNRHITHDGKTQTLSEWAATLNIQTSTLWARIEHYGWTIDRALSTPRLSKSETSKLGHAARWK